jgi:hypothetical protein
MIADASTSEKGKIQLAGDLSGTADAPTVPGLALKANIASPTFTGTPLAPTATAGTSTTQIATTAFVAAAISTGVSGIATNLTGTALGLTAGTVTTNANLTGDVSSSGSNATTIGAGKVTNAMLAGSIDLTSKVTSTLPIANGGTGAATLTVNNVLLGNGTSAVQTVAPGTTGNVLTSDGSTWTSAAASGGLTTRSIGDIYGGGIVFWVTTDGLHGLIAETQDQSTSSTWYTAQDKISQNSTHSPLGKLYTDWRLPTKNELNLLYPQIAAVGNFAIAYYWSSIEYDSTIAYALSSVDGTHAISGKYNSNAVRAVRAF